MKTRDELYSKDATELLRIITTYKTLGLEQLLRLFPGRQKKIQTMILGFEREGRLNYDSESGLVLAVGLESEPPNLDMIDAFWVLLDFIDRAEYHTTGDYPVQIALFADAEMYEIICVRTGQEIFVSNILGMNEDPPRRIIVVDSTSQVSMIDIPNIAGFCTIADDGAVEYYSSVK